jgi:predicted ATPase
MIRKLRVENFKSARDRMELELRPLTLLTGANSSGKSTIMQAILTLAQTASSRTDDRRLILNGGLTRLGGFDDVLSHDAESREIKLGFDLDTADFLGVNAPVRRMRYSALRHFSPAARRDVLVSLDVAFSFPARRGVGDGRSGQSDRRIALESSSVRMFSDVPGSPLFQMVAKRSPSTLTTRARKLGLRAVADSTREFNGLDMQVTFDRHSRQRALKKDGSGTSVTGIVGTTMSHFLPLHLVLKVDAREAIFQDLEAQLHADAEGRYVAPDAEEALPPEALLMALSDVADSIQPGSSERYALRESRHEWVDAWRAWAGGLSEGDRAALRRRIGSSRERLLESVLGKGPSYDLQMGMAPDPIRDAIAHIDGFLRSQVQYIGPLRSAPSPNHPLSPSEELSKVGTQGQHTAAVLYNFKHRAVKPSGISEGTSRHTLEDEVGHWLYFLGLGTEVRTRDLGNMGYELKVVDERGKAHDLTQLGVGVSQVLPILVSGLLARRGDVLLLEQPELHLNPRVQTRLADFLIWLTQNGVQCLVETHSEHMINRLRRRRAEALPSDDSIDSIIYFVEQDGGSSVYRPIEVNEYGGITGWPKGFFDDSQLESQAILSAVAAKRKAMRNA